MPNTDFVGQVKRRKARDAGINESFDMPTLAKFPSRAFYGRVVIDIWNREEFVSHTSYPHEPKKTLHLLEQAILALQSQDIPTITSLDQPGISEDVSGQPFLGTIVVEIWEGKGLVAKRGLSSSNEAIGRSVESLLKLRSHVSDVAN